MKYTRILYICVMAGAIWLGSPYLLQKYQSGTSSRTVSGGKASAAAVYDEKGTRIRSVFDGLEATSSTKAHFKRYADSWRAPRRAGCNDPALRSLNVMRSLGASSVSAQGDCPRGSFADGSCPDPWCSTSGCQYDGPGCWVNASSCWCMQANWCYH